MRSSHLVDPELVVLAEQLTAFTLQMDLDTLPVLREQYAQMARTMAPPAPADAPVMKTVEFAPGPRGVPDVRVLVFRPVAARGPLPVFFHIHGGAYVIGTADISEPNSRHVAQELNCVVVSVDYRLAPETRAPGAVEDCYAALKWLYVNAERLGIDRDRIAIGGESAGGGLAAAFALLVRDRGEVRLSYQSLDSPMLDDRTAANSDPHPYTGEFVFPYEKNRLGWKALLGCEPRSPGVSAYAAAARAENLDGLPPTFICVGALDLFLEEDIEYARRLTRAGVPVELHLYPGAVHGFQSNPEADVSREALRARWRALGRALHR